LFYLPTPHTTNERGTERKEKKETKSDTQMNNHSNDLKGGNMYDLG
jgi:hypothetical protein